MDLLDRLLGHDAGTTRELLLLSRGLSDEQLDREFDLGHRTVRATALHVLRNMEVWADLMGGRLPREAPQEAWVVRLERAAEDLRRVARAVAERGGWDERFLDTLDDPPAEKTYGGAIAHVITHGMHHRAQWLHMLRRLGVEGVPEGDVLGWEARNA
jgi:uncharacterized damage-inducible protein DinB